MTAPKANRLLIDAEEFKADAEKRILAAQDRIYVQAMTFECDRAGYWLLDLLKASNAKDRIMAIDAYSLFNINDGWVFGMRYWTSKAYRKEVKSTRKLLKSANHEGVRIHITNRLGWRWDRFPSRNHKKLLLVDDVAYIGGLNFSEHNFEWHDLMAVVENKEIVEHIASDFHHTLNGQNQSLHQQVGVDQIYFLDGQNSRAVYERIFAEITSAKRSIQIISPYISNPLLDRLTSVDEHVKVQIITPATNNKSIMKHYLMAKTTDLPWEVLQYSKGMSHVKAILIDGKKLIIGSSNFDFVSYHLEQEIVLVSKDHNLVHEFQERVWICDLEKSAKEITSKKTYRGAILLIFVIERIIRFLGRLQRKKDAF